MKKYTVSIQTHTDSIELASFDSIITAQTYAASARCGFEYAGDFAPSDNAAINVHENKTSLLVYARPFTL